MFLIVINILNEATVLYLNSPFLLCLSFGAGQVCPLGGSKTLSVTFTVIFLFLSFCHCCSDLNDVIKHRV